MGAPTLAAGRIIIGGENYSTAIDKLPFSGTIKTYSLDYMSPDSASTGTAYLAGVKTNFYTAGCNGAVQHEDCSSVAGNEVESILMESKRAGKGTGIVTTTRINHASPMAAYAHTSNRKHYSDADLYDEDGTIPENKKACKDIAKQFAEQQDKIDVMMGGGFSYFCPETISSDRWECLRKDGNNYIEQWRNSSKIEFLQSRTELEDLNHNISGNKNSIVGLFAAVDHQYESERLKLAPEEPSLTQMTELAIKRLEQEDKGYYLFVEGGRIDSAHHLNHAVAALYEFAEFDNAIQLALNMTNPEETLILVSADHSHQFTFGGEAKRGQNIFGVGGATTGYPGNLDDDGNPTTSTDDENVQVISYADGPGYKLKKISNKDGEIVGCGRVPPSDTEHIWSKPLDNVQAQVWPATAYSGYASHGGEDVNIQGIGPWAHLVTGVHEQTFVAGLGEFALCLGEYEHEAHCLEENSNDSSDFCTLNYLLLLFIYFLNL